MSQKTRDPNGSPRRVQYNPPMPKLLLLFALLASLLACTITREAAPVSASGQRAGGAAWLGLVFDPLYQGAGVAIRGVLPGPLRQALNTRLDIDLQTDLLLSVNGAAVDAANLSATLGSYRPGDTVDLIFKQAGGPERPGGTTRLAVTLGAAAEWQGPVSKADRSAPSDQRRQALPTSVTHSGLTGLIRRHARQQGLNPAINRLYAFFDQWQRDNRGFHSLSRVLFPFRQPERLLELEQAISEPLATLNQRPEAVFEQIALNLDLAAPVAGACHAGETAGLGVLLDTLAASQRFLGQAFRRLNEAERARLGGDLYYLISEYAELRILPAQLEPLRSLHAINASMKLDFNALLSAAAVFDCLIKQAPRLVPPPGPAKTTLPEAIKRAISGRINYAGRHNGQWIVFGGEADNRYDMSVIDLVYDPAGEDVYQHDRARPFRTVLIIDRAGNDRYLADDIGPAAGWLGTSILLDYAGDDLYQGRLAANGAGMMGVGLLIDYAGRDRYNGHHFSNGAAFYGAGVVLDLGPEADQYHSVTFSQGLGGPRGLGLIYDYRGNDLYRANSAPASVYDTGAVSASFSQGLGFGLRHYDSGGIGIIHDRHGSDRYEGGEFSQGGAYYRGLGILHDAAGNDHYYGNRYSQGFGAHQASGVLFDGGGNDSYWGMTAACQGAAWDIALGLLFDRQGDDTYRGDDLCQGSAAMQAMGWLIDLAGADHYQASGPAHQGRPGPNHYHFDPLAPVYSWSLLLDLGGRQDHFSGNGANNQARGYAELNEKAPPESRAHGLFIDTREGLETGR